MVFVTQDVFRVVFRGGIFGGGHYNCPDPYLTNTIVLSIVKLFMPVRLNLTLLVVMALHLALQVYTADYS